MSSPEVLDFEQLLAPIADDAPCGSSLRRADGSIDPAYDAVKTLAQDARTQERLIERWKVAHDEGEAPPAPPNWRKLEQEAARVIASKSKDLWVTAWLIEALVRNHGFAGARDGFRLVRELAERYWEHLLPVPSEDDYEHPLEFKMSQLAGLSGGDADGVLIAPLRAVPMLESDEFGSLSLADYSLAATISAIADPDARQKRIDNTAAATLDDFDKVVVRTPPARLQALVEVLKEAQDELAKMEAVLEEKCQEEGASYAPPTTFIRQALRESCDMAEAFLRKVQPESATGEQEGEAGGEEASDGGDPAAGAGGATSTGPLRNREDAFRLLMRVSEYFRRAEPHSPLSYYLEQAVRWGRQPLPELLKELISDESVRNEVYQRTGIPPPADDNR